MIEKQIYDVQTCGTYFIHDYSSLSSYQNIILLFLFLVWVAFEFMSLIPRQESLNKLLIITLNFKDNINKIPIIFILNVNSSSYHIATYVCVCVKGIDNV